jgi:hypothetical protein
MQPNILVDLQRKEARNVVLQLLNRAPVKPKKGLLYYDTILNYFRYYNGVRWIDWKYEEFVTEKLTGTIDGVNRVFNTTYSFKDNTIAVYINGLKQTDYRIIDNKTIEFNSPPQNVEYNDYLEITYYKTN